MFKITAHLEHPAEGIFKLTPFAFRPLICKGKTENQVVLSLSVITLEYNLRSYHCSICFFLQMLHT